MGIYMIENFRSQRIVSTLRLHVYLFRGFIPRDIRSDFRKGAIMGVQMDIFSQLVCWLIEEITCFHFPVSNMVILININLSSVFKDAREGIQIHWMSHFAKPERNNKPNLKMDTGKEISFYLRQANIFLDANFYVNLGLVTNNGVISSFGFEKRNC